MGPPPQQTTIIRHRFLTKETVIFTIIRVFRKLPIYFPEPHITRCFCPCNGEVIHSDSPHRTLQENDGEKKMSRPFLGSTLDLGIVSLPFYSLLIVSAVFVGYLLSSREGKRLGLPDDTLLNYAIIAIPVSVLCARIYYVVFNWGSYRKNPLEILYIWHGGLAIYGAVIGGFIAAWILSRKQKETFSILLDALAPSVALGQAIGRWGNYANMEAYGVTITDPNLCFFPFGVEICESGNWVWHMATFFYESILCFLIFLVLWLTRKKKQRSGDTFLFYCLLYGAARTVVEGWRTDSLVIVIGSVTLRISQILSACVCIAVLLILRKRARSIITGCLAGILLLAGIILSSAQAYLRPALWLLSAGTAVSLADLLIDLLHKKANVRSAVTGILITSGAVLTILTACSANSILLLLLAQLNAAFLTAFCGWDIYRKCVEPQKETAADAAISG